MEDKRNREYSGHTQYKEPQDYDQFVDLYRMLQNVFVTSSQTASQYQSKPEQTPPTPPKQDNPKKTEKKNIVSATKVRLIKEQSEERMRSGRSMTVMGFLAMMFLGMPLAIFSLGLFVYGYMLNKQGKDTQVILNRLDQYTRVLQRKDPAKISELASAAGVSKNYVLSDLQQMIEKGLFLEGHLDRANGLMYASHQAYDMGVDVAEYEELKPQDIIEAQEEVEDIFDEDKAPESVRTTVIKAEKYIQKIQRRKKQIETVFVKEQLTEMEATLRQIIEYVIAHPNTANDIDKLMKYYLPTSVKLLDTYRDLDSQTVQGGNIAKSKKDIEEVLVTLNQGYKILLDDLFKDTSMDVSSDISVLESLLAQEGLTSDGIIEKEKVE